MTGITCVGIVGSGSIGGGLAALVARAGVDVVLLDLDEALARAAVERHLKAGTLDEAAARRIAVGSITASSGAIARADWIIEAASEKLSVKVRIFSTLCAARRRGSIISSTTSSLTVSVLAQHLDVEDAAELLATHFFNPPTQMRLLEIAAGEKTRGDIVDKVQLFAEGTLGCKVVRVNDRPGFIANRVGNFWMAVALDAAVARNIDVEQADDAMRRVFGAPKGIFGLLDLVGIDLLQPIWGIMQQTLPPGDALQRYQANPPIISRLVAEGRCGWKTGAGFMRRLPDGSFEGVDLATLEYRPLRDASHAPADGDPGLAAFLAGDDPLARYAAEVTARTLAYASGLVPDVTSSAGDVDLAMREGYGWGSGPLELARRLGPAWLEAELGRLPA